MRPTIRATIVGNGHVHGIDCGDDSASLKWTGVRAADKLLGQALLAAKGDTRPWLAGSIKRDDYNGGD